jgi:hypothetical protein
MLGDELFQTALLRIRGSAFDLNRETAPLVANLPLILSRLIQPFHVDAMLHRNAFIVFPIQQASGRRNRTPGHDFGNENNSSSILVAFFATNVKAQVYLIEIGVKWNGEMAEQLCAAKPKAHKANVCLSLERIESRAGWNEPTQKSGLNLVVLHHEVSPFSRKENSLGLRHLGHHMIRQRIFRYGPIAAHEIDVVAPANWGIPFVVFHPAVARLFLLRLLLHLRNALSACALTRDDSFFGAGIIVSNEYAV